MTSFYHIIMGEAKLFAKKKLKPFFCRRRSVETCVPVEQSRNCDIRTHVISLSSVYRAERQGHPLQLPPPRVLWSDKSNKSDFLQCSIFLGLCNVMHIVSCSKKLPSKANDTHITWSRDFDCHVVKPEQCWVVLFSLEPKLTSHSPNTIVISYSNLYQWANERFYPLTLIMGCWCTALTTPKLSSVWTFTTLPSNPTYIRT